MNLSKLADQDVGRKWWWASFAIALLGVYFARYIYVSNLSFWLNKPDFEARVWSIFLGILCSGIFAFASARRAVEIGAKPKFLLTSILIVPIPFWIMALGLLPTKNTSVPAPIQGFVRRLKITSALAVSLGTLGLVGYLVFVSEHSMLGSRSSAGTPIDVEPEKQIPSLSECEDNGIAYFKEIDSFPYLRSGEFVPDVVVERCGRSLLAFGY